MQGSSIYLVRAITHIALEVKWDRAVSSAPHYLVHPLGGMVFVFLFVCICVMRLGLGGTPKTSWDTWVPPEAPGSTIHRFDLHVL